MKQIKANEPLSQSADIVADNIARLKVLFPELLTEGADGVAVNVDVLKSLVGDKTVSDVSEKYGLNWHGKRMARQLALVPSTGTLRPCVEDSVDWESTQNLMIEGDNLEVLKLLQKSYSGKVKMIYIDPPYNTGKDFVYPDNFKDNIKNYQELTGQIEDGRKITSNPESSGRFHTDWLNMMYPRLMLARNLLRDDGVIFISIDDGELPRVRLAMDELFGEENFIANFIWKSRQNKDNRTVTGASVDHEFIVCYGKPIRGADRDQSQYTNPDNDPLGDWASANMVGIATPERRPNLHYDLIDPRTKFNYGCPEMGWRYERKSMNNLIAQNRILWPSSPDGRPRRKAYLSELDSDYTGFSTIVGKDIFTRNGTADIDTLFSTRIFSFPKPVKLIGNFIEQGCATDGIILDFFAGSGTTAQAIMAQNAKDGENRRYILVQLDEPLDSSNSDQKTAADFCESLNKPRNIAELTKERLRRAATKIKTDNPMFSGDTGFRVFKLDKSNIRAWDPDRNDLERTLLDHQEHLLPNRTQDDVLYEVLLKLGLDLCVPMEELKVNNHTVHAVGGGVLMACFSENIPREDVEMLGNAIVKWRKKLQPDGELKVLFRDSAFGDDVAKTNLSEILKQGGFNEVESI